MSTEKPKAKTSNEILAQISEAIADQSVSDVVPALLFALDHVATISSAHKATNKALAAALLAIVKKLNAASYIPPVFPVKTKS